MAKTAKGILLTIQSFHTLVTNNVRSSPGIEPGTSSTQRRNHTTRPTRLDFHKKRIHHIQSHTTYFYSQPFHNTSTTHNALLQNLRLPPFNNIHAPMRCRNRQFTCLRSDFNIYNTIAMTAPFTLTKQYFKHLRPDHFFLPDKLQSSGIVQNYYVDFPNIFSFRCWSISCIMDSSNTSHVT